MTFKYLEEALVQLPEKQAKKYFDVSVSLQEPTKTLLNYTLDIASYLNNINLDDDYILFGGYAVLSHLMKQFGEEIAEVWRGSEDIDMAGTDRVRNALQSGYSVRDRPSPNLLNKRTLKIKAEEEEECKIDFYTGDMARRFYTPEIHEPFGLKLRVSDPLTLIEGKLMTPQGQDVHSIDIIRMLAVMEKTGYIPKEIATFFTADQKADLIERIKRGHKATEGERFGFVPPRNFREDLEKILRKGRPINIKQ